MSKGERARVQSLKSLQQAGGDDRWSTQGMICPLCGKRAFRVYFEHTKTVYKHLEKQAGFQRSTVAFASSNRFRTVYCEVKK